MTNEPNPEEALASIAAARAEVGRTLEYPAVWDLWYGGVIALMVAGAGLPQPWSVVTLLVSLVGLGLMVRWWRARTGWWVSGFSPRRARWVAIGLGLVLAGCMSLSFWTRFADGPVWAPLLAGGLAGLAGIVGGRWWMAVYRRELAERGQ